MNFQENMGAIQPLQEHYQWVYAKGDQAVTDSLIVAEVFNKDHKNVLRDIEIQMEKLKEAGEGEFSRLNFEPSEYKNERGKTYPKVNLTEDAFTLVAMAYVTPEAMKFKVRFIREFKRIKEELIQRQGSGQLTTEQLTKMLTVRLGSDVVEIKQDVADIKETLDKRMTIDYGQQAKLLYEKDKRVETLYNSGYYDIDRSLFHRKAWSNFKKAFGVSSYRDTLAKDFDEAVAYLKAWRPLI